MIGYLVARLVDAGYLELALQDARSLQGEITSADQVAPVEMLTYIAFFVPNDQRKEIIEEACDKVHSMRKVEDRVNALSILLPYITEDQWGRLKAEVFNDLEVRSLIPLLESAPSKLREDLARDAFIAVQSLKDEQTHANVLNKLIHYLPDVERNQAIHILN